MNSTDFLLEVWGLHCKEGDFVCLSSKAPWKDTLLPYDPNLKSAVTKWLSTNSHKDCYFCPLPFTSARRSKTGVARAGMLWSDIDDANPNKVKPSILWESSPGRFQGLWLLPKVVEPSVAAEMSRQMAYYIGADRGGWDLTQVLRIPGTINYKYPSEPQVKLVHFTKSILKSVPKSPLERWRKTIPIKLLRIIEGPATEGKRSDMLWYLEHELCDLGVPLKDVIDILKASSWNKYRGRADEEERFEAERVKIQGDRAETKQETRTESLILTVDSYSDVLSRETQSPGWIVPGFWMKGSHGIIAGEPKSFKTTLILDLMFSVASCTPFLGVHGVQHSGPTLFVQNENADWIIRDKLQKLMVSRGTAGRTRVNGKQVEVNWSRDLPMHFINQQGFTLDDAAYKEALEELIDRMRPAMVVLDPLYLMFSGDVNSAKDLAPVLQWALRIRNEYGCALALVHHYNKGGEGKRAGQRMLGSTTLHGWIESAWYIQAGESTDSVAHVSMEREFRGAGLHPKRDLSIEMGDFGDMKYIITETEDEHHSDDVLLLLEQSTQPLSQSAVSQALGISRRQAKTALDRLVSERLAIKRGERYIGVDNASNG
jgi:hypothetical protein